MIERLSETIRLKEFKTVERLPASVAELPKNSKNLVRDIEKLYVEIATRINWLLARAKGSYYEIVPSGSLPGDDGNWRLYVSGDDFLIQRKVSGTWTTAQAIKGS